MPSDIEALIAEAARQREQSAVRRGRSVLLLPKQQQIKTLMEGNVSLPAIMKWLAENGIVVTLQTLRNFVIRVFGRDYYDDYAIRNGWSKSKGAKNKTPVIKENSNFKNPMQLPKNNPASPLDKLEQKPTPGEFNPTPDKSKLYGD